MRIVQSSYLKEGSVSLSPVRRALFTFRSFKQALLVVGNIPFALASGIAALWLRGMNLSLSASVGFIALFGVAMLNGVVLVSSINQAGEPGKQPTSPGADDSLCCELWLHSHGALDIDRGGASAPARECGERRTRYVNAFDVATIARSLSMDFREWERNPNSREKSRRRD